MPATPQRSTEKGTSHRPLTWANSLGNLPGNSSPYSPRRSSACLRWPGQTAWSGALGNQVPAIRHVFVLVWHR